MFHRVLGLSSVLLVCLAGCSLCSHHDSAFCQHRHEHRNSGIFDAACGEDLACTCAAPLYPGDQHSHGNCRKHGRERRMRRMARAYGRSASRWMLGSNAVGHGYESCGHEPYVSQPMMWEQDVWGQPVCGIEPFCGVGPAYGCDSCAPLMTDGWSADGYPGMGESFPTAVHGSTGCNCGQQHSMNETMYIPEGNDPNGYPMSPPMMNIPPDSQNSMSPRSFPPSHPLEAPTHPTPVPQDLTPMDVPTGSPESAPGQFDPLQNEGAPAADRVLDPVSFEIPRLPPLPERAHSSVKRGGTQQVELISTDAEQFRR